MNDHDRPEAGPGETVGRREFLGAATAMVAAGLPILMTASCNGDEAKITRRGTLDNGGADSGSVKGDMTCTVKLTEAIMPGVIALSHHFGHWQYGRYASGNASPMADETIQTDHAAGDVDAPLKWWNKNGARPNWVIPNAGDPISGALRFFDTVVNVAKV